MGFQIQSGATTDLQTIDPTSKAGRTTLYDAYGAVIAGRDKLAVPAGQSYMPIMGLDGGTVLRAMRVGEYGSQRVTSEVALFHDGMEGSNVNANWTQSVGSSETVAQANGVLTLNNSGLTTAGGYAIVTSQRQFPKYPRQPLYARMRVNISAAPAGNHSLVEWGFGAPSGATAIINNGAFFRQRADGTIAIVLSYNGTEQVTQVLAQGVINTSNYYYADIIVDDDFARFLLYDSAGNMLVDQTLSQTTSIPYTWAVSHLPTFGRHYVDGTGGGTLVKLNLGAHQVQLLDAANNKPWAEQQAGALRNWNQSPLTQAQTCKLADSAPSAFTPVNGANSTITTLGGEYIGTMTAASENRLSMFAYQVPAPYTLYIRGIYWSLPYVSTVFSISTTAPYILPFLVVNSASNALSGATGQGFPFGQMWTAAITAAVGTMLTGQAIIWTPQTAVACLPGTYVHLGWKCLNAGAVTTGAIRGSVMVDGYFE